MSDLAAENARLREQLEEYRRRELDDLRSQLAEALAAKEHYRAEAQRNADAGRQIAAQYQQQVADLRARVQVFEQPNVRRPA